MKGIIRKGSKSEERLRLVADDVQKKISTGKMGRLSLTDMYAICNCGKELMKHKAVNTVVKNVADYFKRFGFMVTMDFNNVNYVIVEV